MPKNCYAVKLMNYFAAMLLDCCIRLSIKLSFLSNFQKCKFSYFK